jgi:hypothetical protein
VVTACVGEAKSFDRILLQAVERNAVVPDFSGTADVLVEAPRVN